VGTVRWAELEAQGLEAGLDVVRATTAEPFTVVRQILEERRDAGLNGTMQFTYRNPERSTDPERTLPGARTLIAGATSYHRDPPARPVDDGPVARVARYVWADDRERLLAGLQAMCDALTGAGHRACVVSDQNHLVDRPVAERAGLGWFGKNANLLLPGHGSWYLLGTVLTDAALPDAPRAEPVADGCGTCERCRPACPTGAIVEPGTVDARLCLSWTLQMTGSFPRDQRVALGDRLYGCDECQEVCPPNRLEVRRAAPGGSGTPVALGRPDRAWVSVLGVLGASDEELLDRHGRWYIPKRDPRYLRRNALVVLGNVGDGADPAVCAALARALADDDPLLRAHAVWSARRLGCDDLLVDVTGDPDPEVQAELAAAVPVRAPA
jgi:epoxyqueuosine reductase